MLTLTVKEIIDLARAADIPLDADNLPADDELDQELTIKECPPGGVQDDDGKLRNYRLIAFYTDYPDEGCMPLGEELAPDDYQNSVQAAAGGLTQTPLE